MFCIPCFIFSVQRTPPTAYIASMSDLFRDTVFGHAVRIITKGRYLQFVEEKDPSIWKQYIHRKQTKNMALYGRPDDDAPEEKQERESAPVSETPGQPNGNANGADLSEGSPFPNAR